MGWYGDMVWDLNEAIKGFLKYPENSLGRVIYAERWNAAAGEIDGANWTDMKSDIKIPAEFAEYLEIEDEESCPFLFLPEYDFNSLLIPLEPD